MPASLHSFIPPVKRVIPRSDVRPSMYNVAKERIHFAQTAKADVGGRGRPPSLPSPAFTYMGKTHTICQNLSG